MKDQLKRQLKMIGMSVGIAMIVSGISVEVVCKYSHLWLSPWALWWYYPGQMVGGAALVVGGILVFVASEVFNETPRQD